MEKITAGRTEMGSFAPKFAQLNDDVLFGEVWAREDKLSARDRCLITVSALMASGILDNGIHHITQRCEDAHAGLWRVSNITAGMRAMRERGY